MCRVLFDAGEHHLSALCLRVDDDCMSSGQDRVSLYAWQRLLMPLGERCIIYNGSRGCGLQIESA